jgi:hypothetical protein
VSILNALLSSAQGGALQQLGIDDAGAQVLLKNIVPALTGGMKKNVAGAGGIEALTNALGQGNHERYLDEPDALRDSFAITDGNGILGHLLGSKDVSREVASRASSSTGIDDVLSLGKKLF